jgi:hypothetical protein
MSRFVIEEGSGVFARHLHSHNGYHAGDFVRSHPVAPAAWNAPLPAFVPVVQSRRAA